MRLPKFVSDSTTRHEIALEQVGTKTCENVTPDISQALPPAERPLSWILDCLPHPRDVPCKYSPQQPCDERRNAFPGSYAFLRGGLKLVNREGRALKCLAPSSEGAERHFHGEALKHAEHPGVKRCKPP